MNHTIGKLKDKFKDEVKLFSRRKTLLKDRTRSKALKIKNKIEKEVNKSEIKATRKNLQIGRRMAHMSLGILTGTIYAFFLNKESAVSIFGIIATLTYLFEHARLRYPEHASKFRVITKYFLRAEEQLKESAALPYVMAILLTIITFPKLIALCGIFTLAISDPLSAIIGIKFGTKRNANGKSKEGSLAFFITSLIITSSFFYMYNPQNEAFFVFIFLTSTLITFFERLPLKIDDNLTIPLLQSLLLWMMAAPLEIVYF